MTATFDVHSRIVWGQFHNTVVNAGGGATAQRVARTAHIVKADYIVATALQRCHPLHTRSGATGIQFPLEGARCACITSQSAPSIAPRSHAPVHSQRKYAASRAFFSLGHLAFAFDSAFHYVAVRLLVSANTLSVF